MWAFRNETSETASWPTGPTATAYAFDAKWRAGNVIALGLCQPMCVSRETFEMTATTTFHMVMP